ATAADERHLFVWVENSHDQAVAAFAFPFMPERAPILPEYVDAVWAVTAFDRAHIWQYHRAHGRVRTHRRLALRRLPGRFPRLHRGLVGSGHHCAPARRASVGERHPMVLGRRQALHHRPVADEEADLL